MAVPGDPASKGQGDDGLPAGTARRVRSHRIAIRCDSRSPPVRHTALAAGFAAPAMSQDVSAPCRLCGPSNVDPSAKTAVPISLGIETRLDFDRLILDGSGSGSAELGPDGVQTVSGSVTAIGARATVGKVTIRGEPGRLVRITLPDRIELSGLSGGTLNLESIRSDVGPAPRLGADGTLSFRFGGVIRTTGDIDGNYRGDVQIDVDYF